MSLLCNHPQNHQILKLCFVSTSPRIISKSLDCFHQLISNASVWWDTISLTRTQITMPPKKKTSTKAASTPTRTSSRVKAQAGQGSTVSSPALLQPTTQPKSSSSKRKSNATALNTTSKQRKVSHTISQKVDVDDDVLMNDVPPTKVTKPAKKERGDPYDAWFETYACMMVVHLFLRHSWWKVFSTGESWWAADGRVGRVGANRTQGQPWKSSNLHIVLEDGRRADFIYWQTEMGECNESS